jgi:hypothetical protein
VKDITPKCQLWRSPAILSLHESREADVPASRPNLGFSQRLFEFVHRSIDRCMKPEHESVIDKTLKPAFLL